MTRTHGFVQKQTSNKGISKVTSIGGNNDRISEDCNCSLRTMKRTHEGRQLARQGREDGSQVDPHAASEGRRKQVDFALSPRYPRRPTSLRAADGWSDVKRSSRIRSAGHSKACLVVTLHKRSGVALRLRLKDWFWSSRRSR